MVTYPMCGYKSDFRRAVVCPDERLHSQPPRGKVRGDSVLAHKLEVEVEGGPLYTHLFSLLSSEDEWRSPAVTLDCKLTLKVAATRRMAREKEKRGPCLRGDLRSPELSAS